MTAQTAEIALTRREMFGYGVGDFACGLMWNTLVMFLMFFYTEVFGISAVASGTMLLVARIIDGFGDIGVGLWVDRTRSRWGRCRPFLLYGSPLLALFALTCFYVPGISPEAKLVYAYISYTGLMLCYSLVNVPYGALLALLTPVPAERTRTAGMRMACATVGWMVVSGLTLPLVGLFGAGSPQRGWFLTMAVFAGAALALLWFCFGSVRERVQPERAPRALSADLRALLGSRAWKVMALTSMMLFVGVLMPAGTTMYYFTYVVKQPALASWFFLLCNVGNLAGVVLSDALTRRFCKLQVMRWSLLPTAALPLLYLVIDPAQTWQVFALGFTNAMVGFLCAPIFHSMVADTADSIELVTGRRVVGLSASALSLAIKVGAGLGSALTGLLLAHAGYRAGTEQTPEAMHGIVLCMSVGPCVAFVLMWLVLQFYPLGRGELNEMQQRLALKRAAA